MAVKTQTVKKPRKKSTKTQATKDKEKMAKRLRTGKAGTPKKAKVSKQGGIPFKMKKPTSFGMRSLPETHLTKKGLSLKNLVRSTPRIFINNAIDVEAHRVTKLKTKTGRPTLKGIMWTNDKWRPHKSRRYHETYLIGLDDDQTKPIYRHKRIIAQCDCITGDTKVLTSNGWQKIFDIAEPLVPNHFPIQYNVNGKFYKGSAPFYKGMQQVYKVDLVNGRSITATPDHEVLVHRKLSNNRTKQEWVAVKNLADGDLLVLNTFTPDPVERNSLFWDAFFIGLLQGDGTLFASGRPNIKLYGKKTGLYSKLYSLGFAKAQTEIKNGINVHLTHRAIEVCSRYKYDNINIPALNSHAEVVGYFSGLFCADGTSYAGGKLLIRGAKEYLEPLQLYLMQYGYTLTTLYKERSANVTTSTINGKVLRSTKELWALSTFRATGIIQNMVLPAYHRNRIGEDKAQNNKTNAVKVTGITPAAKQHVYDIYVPEVNMFAANGVIVHNCESYFYTFEYANAMHGAAYLIYSNGDPPDYMNPGYMPGMCIGENELVFTSQGAKKIRDIVVGDKVTTMGEYSKVIATRKTGTKITYRLRTKTTSVRMTLDHPVYGVINGKLDWHPLSEYKVGDHVVAILESGFGQQVYDPALAKVLGYMISEGSHTNFSNFNTYVLNDFLRSCKTAGVVANKSSDGTGAIVSRASLRFLRSVGLTQGSYNHKVPAYLFGASKSEVKEFLRAAYAGDGYITNSVSTYATVSGVLARDIQTLLTMFGVRTTLNRQNESGVNKVPLYMVRTSSVEETQRLIAAIDPIRKERFGEMRTGVPTAREFVPFNVVRELCRLHPETVGSEDFVRYNDLCARYSVSVESFRKKAQPFIVKIQDRVGGKATNYIKVSDFLSLTSQYRAAKTLRKKGWTLGNVTKRKAVNKWRKSELPSNLKGEQGKFIKRMQQDRLVFEPIQNIGAPRMENVYDLEVENESHFVANGIVVHNCKHLIALARICIDKDY